MTTSKSRNYSIGKDPVELRVSLTAAAQLRVVATSSESAGWETTGAPAPSPHLSPVTDWVRIHSLDPHRHSTVRQTPDDASQNKANDGSDCSLSKYHTLKPFSTKIL